MKPVSFAELVCKEYRELSSSALKFTRDSDAAKDLLQETMLRALSHADKYIHGGNIKGWLCSIMKNAYINDYKKSVKIRIVSDCLDIGHPSAMLNCATRNLSEKCFLNEDIKKALQRLPNTFSQPFLAHF